MTRHRNSQSAKWARRTKKRAQSMLKSILALDFLDQIVHLKDLEDAALSAALLTYMEKQKVSAMRKSSASRRRFRQRKSWNAFQANLTDRQFRRYFRMSRECFAYLCNMIESNVGEEVFKSEEYLNALRTSNKDEDKVKAQTMNAHDQSTGGFISGEVKMCFAWEGGCRMLMVDMPRAEILCFVKRVTKSRAKLTRVITTLGIMCPKSAHHIPTFLSVRALFEHFFLAEKKC